MTGQTSEFAAPAEACTPAAVQARRWRLFAAGAWVADLMLAILIAMFVIVFLYRPVKVEGTSMMPTLYDQERLFINQFSYKFGDIKHGDTVVFWYPEDTTRSYIKRVIGLPGDRVAVDDGYVFLNGKRLDESYVPPRYRDDRSYPETVIPSGKYFVLGDDRVSSNDSRSWGLVPRSYIYGKAAFVFWPLDRIGTIR